jgi:hypothetical protein
MMILIFSVSNINKNQLKNWCILIFGDELEVFYLYFEMNKCMDALANIGGNCEDTSFSLVILLIKSTNKKYILRIIWL